MKKKFKIYFISYLSVVSMISFSCTKDNLMTVSNNSLNENNKKGLSFNQFKDIERNNILNKFKNKKDTTTVDNIAINTGMISKNGKLFKIESQITRNKKFLLGTNPTNNSNINLGDYNIFNPKDPNSLKGLPAYEGNVVDENNLSLSTLKINDDQILKFETDVAIVKFKTINGLNLFKTLYNAEIQDELDGYYKLKVDINKSPIEKTEQIIENFNSKLPKSIKNIQFGSLSSIKLFLIMCDFLLNHTNELENIEFNMFSEEQASEINVNDWLYGKDVISSSSNAYPIKSWWLTSTNVLTPLNQSNPDNNIKPKAWNYSIGSGVKIATIDDGFNLEHPEYKRRILNDVNMSKNDFSGSNNHGTQMSLVIGAERNNNIGSVGVSPNVFIAPYTKGGTSWVSALSLKYAVKNGAKIVNYSHVITNDLLFKIAEVTAGIRNPEMNFEKQIKDALEKDKVTFVCSAGNNALPIDRNFPATLSDIDGIIVVGGVDIVPLDSKGEKVKPPIEDYSAAFNPKPSLDTTNNGKGSGYGTNLVWAPWQDYYFSDFNSPYEAKTPIIGGTSAAAAFTSGAIALMLSRNTHLSPQEIEGILHETSFLTVRNHQYMIDSNFNENIKLIDVEKAVKKAISKIGNPDDYMAKDQIGYFELSSNALNSNDTNNKPIGILTHDDGTTVKILRTASDKEFTDADKKVVNFKGWSSSLTPSLKDVTGYETLNISPILDKPQINSISGNASNGSLITITGTNFFSPKNNIRVNFKNGSGQIYTTLLNNKSVNNGTELSFVFDKKKILNTLDGSEIPTGNYSIELQTNLGISNTYNSNGFSISSASLPSHISYKERSVPIILPDIQIPIGSGGMIAIPVTEFIKNGLNNTRVLVGGKEATLLDIVSDFAIYGLNKDTPKGVQDIILQKINTGEKIYTFEEALYFYALLLDLNPLYPPGALPIPGQTNYPQFIQPNPSSDPNKIKNVNTNDILAVSINGLGPNDNVTVKIGDISLPIYQRVGDYISFKIPEDTPLGLHNITISNGRDSLDIVNSVNISHTQSSASNYKILYSSGSTVTSFSPNAINNNYQVISQNYYQSLPISQGRKIVYRDYYNDEYKFYITNSDGSNGHYFMSNPLFNEFQNDYISNFDNPKSPLGNVFSSDGNKVVGLQYNLGATNIVICDGSNINFPIDDLEQHSSPRWSNDDKYISFLGYKFTNEHMYSLNIINMKNSGTYQKIKLFESTDNITWYSWSPDSSKIVFETTNGSNSYSGNMYIADVNTQAVTNITPDQVETSSNSSTWHSNWNGNNEIVFTGSSKDGSDDYIYYTYGSYNQIARGSNLFKINTTTGIVNKFNLGFTTTSSYSYFYNPIVSPDGKYIILHIYTDSVGKVYYISLNDNKLHFLSYGSSGGWVK